MRDSRSYRAARRNLYKLTKRANPRFQWKDMPSSTSDVSSLPSPEVVRHALSR